MDFLGVRLNCEKIVGRSKYDRIDPEIQKWWNALFKSLEDKYYMPFYKREKYLKKCFSEDMLQDLINIGIEISHDEEEDKPKQSEHFLESLKKRLQTEAVKRKKITKKEEVTNPYLNFVKKSKAAAQIWRPQKKADLEELSLMEKAENITENLAEDFDEWFQNVGGQRKTEINKEVILDLFQMIFNYPAATSLTVRIRELGSVPQQIADAIKQPQYSASAAIRRQIAHDVSASSRKPMTVAFGKTLPFYLRRKPFTENVRDKWLKCYVRHENIESMAAVWEGLTELQSTRSFCLWLLNHPDIPPPSFLKKAGLINAKVLSEPVYSAYQLVCLSDMELPERSQSGNFNIGINGPDQ